MWFKLTIGIGLIGISYKILKYFIQNNTLYIPRFLISRDIPLKNVLVNKQIILEIGVSGYGSFLKIRDLDENVVSLVKLINVNSYSNKDEKVIEYIFEDDSKLSFKKDKFDDTLCYYEYDNQMICHEYVNNFINNYKIIGFNTDFDLIEKL